MFTRDIKKFVALGKSRVKWSVPNTPSAAPAYDEAKDNTLVEIKARLADIKNIPDVIVQARMLNIIRSSIKNIAIRNDAQKATINREIDAALADGSGFSTEAK